MPALVDIETATLPWPEHPSADDAMARACRLAQGAVGLSDPNPRVGCVIVSADGRLLGEGHTQAAGSAHAEVAALRHAAAQGHDVRGARVYVTLEPCSHHGRTPPCCDALAAAGIAQVEFAARDPNPKVDGRGVEALRRAGILVSQADSRWTSVVEELNCGFFHRMRHGRPWVRLKVAASLDGKTALQNGASQWITGLAARQDGHAWRRRSGAVLTGIGTVRADDPRLDVRWVPTARQPLRVVVDARLELAPNARLLEGGEPILIYCAELASERAAALKARGAMLVCLPEAHGRVDLNAVLADLARREVNEVHVEAGARLNASWLAGGHVDEILLYMAPTWLGPGRAMADLPVLSELPASNPYAFHEIERLGGDLRIRLRRNPQPGSG